MPLKRGSEYVPTSRSRVDLCVFSKKGDETSADILLSVLEREFKQQRRGEFFPWGRQELSLDRNCKANLDKITDPSITVLIIVDHWRWLGQSQSQREQRPLIDFLKEYRVRVWCPNESYMRFTSIELNSEEGRIREHSNTSRTLSVRRWGTVIADGCSVGCVFSIYRSESMAGSFDYKWCIKSGHYLFPLPLSRHQSNGQPSSLIDYNSPTYLRFSLSRVACI